jgi:fluoride ion exporter CrcB/FEX
VKIPRRIAPYLFGCIQVVITTGVATAIATFSTLPMDQTSLSAWVVAWVKSLAVMVPFVILIAPMIQRTVLLLTTEDRR